MLQAQVARQFRNHIRTVHFSQNTKLVIFSTFRMFLALRKNSSLKFGKKKILGYIGDKDRIQQVGAEALRRLRNFRKQAYEQLIFRPLFILCITLQFHTIKSSMFTKIGDFLSNYIIFFKLFGTCGVKNLSFQPFLYLFDDFGTETCVT